MNISPKLVPIPRVWKPALNAALLVVFVSIFTSSAIAQPPQTENPSPQLPAPLQKLAEDFWQWRARFQPFTSDDIPRLDRPSVARDWSAASITEQRAALAVFEERWKGINTAGWSIANQVDYRLIGSALARVRWELDINPRWQRDPSFYVDQTLAALTEALLQPSPFDAARSRVIVERMEQIPAILDNAKANLHPVRPFAELAVESLQEIRPKLLRVQRDLTPMLPGDSTAGGITVARFQAATEKAVVALESYR